MARPHHLEVLGLGLILAFGCKVGPTSSTPVSAEAQEEFLLAQANVYSLTRDPRVLGLGADIFRLVEEEPEGIWPDTGQPYFDCHGPVYGCYDAGRNTIHWPTGLPTVLRHEYGHGIMEVLRLEPPECPDGWKDWEHTYREGAENCKART